MARHYTYILSKKVNHKPQIQHTCNKT